MSLDGWTPTRLRWRDGRGVLELRDLRGIVPDDPFYEQTLERAMREPYRLLFTREADASVLADAPAVRPDGLIFHCSRCGSTLVTTMLRALDATVALSEPALLDQILGAPVDAATRFSWLRGALGALVPDDAPAGRRFVKLDSWSIHDLAIVRAAFPGVPWVFLAREPVGVLASQMRMRGMHMVPGVIAPQRLGLTHEHAFAMAPEEYCARVLASLYESAADGLDADARVVDYAALPGPGVDAVLAHFSIAPSAAERARIDEVAGFDAKNPVLAFAPQTQQTAPRLAEAAERFAAAPYARLVGAC